MTRKTITAGKWSELQRVDKVDITDNFPARWAEKNDKLVKVTKENLKEYTKLLKEKPAKYIETKEV